MSRTDVQYKKRYRRFLLEAFKPLAGRLMTLLLFLLISIGLQLYNPYLLRDFIDGATEGISIGSLIRISVIFIVVALGYQLFSIILTYMGETIGWRATNAVRIKLARHYLAMDTSKQRQYSPGEIIERIDGDVGVLQNFFSHFLVKLTGNLAVIVGVLVLLTVQDWRIGIALGVFACTTFFLLEKIRAAAEPYWEKARDINARFFGFVAERLEGKEDLRSNGGLIYVMNGFHRFLKLWFPMLRKAQLLGYSMWIATICVFAVGSCIVLGIGGTLYIQGTMTLGTLFMLLQFTEILMDPVEKIREQLNDLQKANASIRRIIDMLAIQPTIRSGDMPIAASGAFGIEFDQVSFSYSENKPVLQSLNFKLEPGRKLGLLGRTGSGKSSIAKLLMRLYDPVIGVIRFNGLDIRDYDLQGFRKRIGFVSQEVKLFNASLRDNLTLYNPYISDQSLLERITELGLKPWFDALPNGLDTLLLESGSGLSAGEGQLISLVRVFLLDPGLVILDETSSRLDLNTELMIEKAITRLLSGRTAVIIAHKMSTIRLADEVMVISAGHIVEYGDRARLYEDPSSHYYQLSRQVFAEEVG